MFVADVAAGRKTDRATVLRDYGQGRCLTAAEAHAAGMVDEIAPPETVMARVQSGVPTSAPLAAMSAMVAARRQSAALVAGARQSLRLR